MDRQEGQVIYLRVRARNNHFLGTPWHFKPPNIASKVSAGRVLLAYQSDLQQNDGNSEQGIGLVSTTFTLATLVESWR